jgi:hypothetical protein
MLTVTTTSSSEDISDESDAKRSSSIYSLDERLAEGDEESSTPSRLSALVSHSTSPASVQVKLPKPTYNTSRKRQTSASTISLVDYPVSNAVSPESARTHFTGYTFGLPASPREGRKASNATSFFTNMSRSTVTTPNARSREGSVDQTTGASMRSFGEALSPLSESSQTPISRAQTQVAQRPPRSLSRYGSQPSRRRPSADDVLQAFPRPLMLSSLRRVMNGDGVSHRPSSPKQ